MKKIASLLLAILFFALCLVPSLGMLLVGESRSGANEVLAVRPSLLKRDGSLNTEYLSGFADYIDDRFALRQECITLWARLNAGILHTSISEDVVLGRSGWLYYAPTLSDYIGDEPMTERELWCAARTLFLLQEYAEAQGGQFLFTVAPNKNSLYGENMPDCTPANGIKNADALAVQMRDMGVNYLDLFSVFENEAETLYFRTDSHWNGKGAALAADAILSALGREGRYHTGEFTAAEHRGDLYEMLFPAGKETEADHVYAPGFGYVYTSRTDDPDSIILTTEDPAGDGTLLLYRDSFGRNLYPYLADSFSSAVISRKNDYDPTILSPGGTLVIELVERNLRYLNLYAPTLPAPVREPDAGLTEVTAEITEEKCALEGFRKFTGHIAQELPARAGVFVLYGDTLFEAVPTPEGFSVCLPGDIPDEIRVFIS